MFNLQGLLGMHLPKVGFTRMKRCPLKRFLWGFLVWLGLINSLVAGSPILVTFDGTFSDANTGLINGNRDVRISLNNNVDAALGNFGTSVWEETHTQIPFRNGYMAIELGKIQPFQATLFSGDAPHFIVEISGVSGRVAVPIRYIPLAVRATLADSVVAVSANAIQGVLSADKLVGAYGQITSIGSLTATLNATMGIRVGSMFVVDPGRGVGIGLSDPTERLEITGNIKLRNGRIVFSDGTSLASAQALQSASSGGPVVSANSVFIEADTDKNFTGEIQLKTGDVQRITIKNDGKVGIGVSNPIQEFEVNGAILVRNTTITNPGAIRFDGAHFEGFDGISWKQLDVQSNAAGGWLYNDQTDTIVTQREAIKSDWVCLTLRCLWR